MACIWDDRYFPSKGWTLVNIHAVICIPALSAATYQLICETYYAFYFSWTTSCCNWCCRICCIFHSYRLLFARTLTRGLYTAPVYYWVWAMYCWGWCRKTLETNWCLLWTMLLTLFSYNIQAAMSYKQLLTRCNSINFCKCANMSSLSVFTSFQDLCSQPEFNLILENCSENFGLFWVKPTDHSYS